MLHRYALHAGGACILCFAGSPALGIEGAIAPEQSSVVPRVYRLILFRISTMGNLTATDIDDLLTCFARLLG